MKEEFMRDRLYKMLITNGGFQEENVETEKKIPKGYSISGQYNPIADVVVEDPNHLDCKGIAIECKTRGKTSSVKAVGQALNYKVSGYYSYICVLEKQATLNLVNICNEAGIGLILFDPKASRGPVDGGVSVVLDRHNAMKSSSHGYIRDNKVDIMDVLDVLGVDTYSDLMNLEEDLERLKMMKLPEGDYRTKTHMLKGCLPEEKHTVARVKI